MGEEKDINLVHDGIITIATGKSRKETIWKTTQLKWSDLVIKGRRTIYTQESVEEYKSFSKAHQDDIKDVGGFVGGYLSNGKRKAGSVVNRTIITLDIDFGKPDLWNIIKGICDYACCIYSTHKHSKVNPRLRLLIPLTRPITPEEYEAVARKIAEAIGMEYFDDTTYEPSRLMYWPSTSRDGVYDFDFVDKGWANPDEILGKYVNWKDASTWPQSSRVDKVRKKEAENQGNPREKGGMVGAFCRTYTVPNAIEEYLGDIYSRTLDKNRYTYNKGSTAAGLIIYEDGDFAYSHHGTDPAAGKLYNAFNLVRVHKFGHLDDKSKENTPMGKLPSYKAMSKFSAEASKVKVTIGQERLMSIITDFDIIDNVEEENTQWMENLQIDDKGFYTVTIDNVVLVLNNDPYLKGKIAYNEFSNRIMMRENLPWHKLENICEGDPWEDSDDASLRHYIEKVYGINHLQRVGDALAIVATRNKYHPIREYLEKIDWDGVPRVDTLFIDYLGAEDCDYVRKVTRKELVAAVGRVFHPGIKFDYMLVLVGKQGIGKSHILNLLGQNWYSDSLNTVQGKEAYEQLQDAWIIEMAELSATKNAESEAVKHFISKRADSYRMAYGRNVKKIQRQCVFFGTTNNDEFLKDRTGNRKVWPVKVGVQEITKSIWKDMNQEIIDQIWAEAASLWKQGESQFLNEEEENTASQIQKQHTEESSKTGMIIGYLDMLLPDNWSKMDLGARRHFIHGGDFEDSLEGVVKRDKVCVMEIWMELLYGETRYMTYAQKNEIRDVLRNAEGWKQYTTGEGKLSFGNLYGNQRAFVRVDSYSEAVNEVK